MKCVPELDIYPVRATVSGTPSCEFSAAGDNVKRFAESDTISEIDFDLEADRSLADVRTRSVPTIFTKAQQEPEALLHDTLA